MSTLRLALRMLSRDWRAGELTVLIAAMVLAVASVGTVGFFADRVKGALDAAGEPAAGRRRADLRRPAAAGCASRPKRRSAASRPRPALKFNSMVQRAGADAAGSGAVLADVKAVAPGYPLRGAILLVDAARADGTRADGDSAARRSVARRAARRAARRRASATRLAVGDATLTVARDRPAGAGGRERPARDRAAPAHQHRRRARDEPAAARQSRHVPAARRRPRDARRARSVPRLAASGAEARPADGERPRPAAGGAADARARREVSRARRRSSR